MKNFLKCFLKGFCVFFFGLGIIVYTSMFFSNDPSVDPTMRPFLLALDILFAFFIFLLLRKKKPKPENNSIDFSTDTITKEKKPLKPTNQLHMNKGIGDIFKANENRNLKTRISKLENLLSPEMRESLQLQEKINQQNKMLDDLEKNYDKSLGHQTALLKDAQKEFNDIQQKILAARANLVETEEAVLLQSFGLYTPKFKFANATGYKEELDRIRRQQKDCIKNGTAATGNDGWTVNGDKRAGKKMIHDMQKLLIRAFNTECDDVIDHVKFNNIEAAEKRIQTSFATISKLGAVCGVAITEEYKNLKVKELYLAHEYQIEKQNEKEHLRELRAEERERVKLEKEIEAERQKLEKEKKHYSNALQQIIQQIASANSSELPALEAKKAELESKAADIDTAMEKVDYRAANQKAGYVYIISNVGAFGEGVYKIGMTRRLEPMDRIDELGDASVPFNFDVHALIFSDDAPALEAALHRAFEDRKLNMINTRREFFRVSLDEIKEVIKKNFDKTVEFIDVAPAEQYRHSELMRDKYHELNANVAL